MRSASPLQQVRDRCHGGREFVNDISYIPQLNIVFAFISKNASSLLKSLLAGEGALSSADGRLRNPHVRANTGFLGIDDVGLERMEAWIADPSVPNVIVGRDPAARLVSAWHSRVETWTLRSYQSDGELQQWLELRQRILGHARRSHSAPPQEALTRDVSFEMLVDYVCQTPSWLLDRHLSPQTFLSGADLITYDVVGRLDDLEGFIDRLQSLTGVALPPADQSFANVSPSNAGAEVEVTQDQLRRIHERFSSDYAFFGFQGCDL